MGVLEAMAVVALESLVLSADPIPAGSLQVDPGSPAVLCVLAVAAQAWVAVAVLAVANVAVVDMVVSLNGHHHHDNIQCRGHQRERQSQSDQRAPLKAAAAKKSGSAVASVCITRKYTTKRKATKRTMTQLFLYGKTKTLPK